MELTIGLIGDYSDEVIAHVAIPKAIQISAAQLQININTIWISTNEISLEKLQLLDAVWCVPASPYENMDNALMAIKYARENKLPYLGTCGGYQHAALEFAQNVLDYPQAGNSEVDPDTEMPLISSLVCKLVEKTDVIHLKEDSIVQQIYQKYKIEEDYHCSFGVNPEYLSIFENSKMTFVGHDDLGDPRVFELTDHPFFIGSAYQPERSANRNKEHPLITAFLRSIINSK